SSNAGQTAFVTPFINKYGYLKNGVATGGGTVGYGTFTQNDDSFYRKSGQVAYNMTIGGNVQHDLHFGYLRHNDAEDLFRVSNGWGSITIPGGSVNCTAAICGTAQPIYFQAVFNAQSINVPGVPSKLHSEFKSQSFEINDTIHMKNWTFNVGVLDSNDSLYGQGLKPADNLAGWVSSPGSKYKMYEFKFKDMIQPRLGTTWAYNGTDTVYASFARYNPEANSDARAASWDRNFITRTVTADFDQNGKLIGVAPVAGSSGKLWVPGTKPTENKEWLLGTARQLSARWSGRLYTRYKKGDHFMEDTNNTARVVLNAPPGVPNTPYIPDLSDRLKAIGSGSTYVIANLDGAFTKYYEATAETTYNGSKFFVTGSLTWSHYYGNFDQDNSTTSLSNDGAIFIGSSNIGDGAGHQVWNNMYGNLRGDRPISFKINGAYTLPWKSTVGAFLVYQSGQPYALWSNLPYAGLPLPDGSNDTAKYAEPAGSRRTPAIHQLDLNYTQNFPVWRGVNFQLLVDMFNVTNTQTGYNYENRMSVLGACNTSNCISTPVAALPSVNAPYPNSFLNPRRFQVAARVQF
ncbi:MAG TPA: carboxypeptidase regulatory-like domain-containing protein, partial [Thermoanaerobaculia bacterium]|nr:carboxypeptidase regulatory-like domain-containing protein [Thermoanaerobaculia bacterium]